ncbi:MAG: indolepyruvate ferredoxin oxidoreductase family protein [Betaproteobacteria bacterium]|nr:indolepyruvate ferredoxin oxidoreductase family protein [Betaproteobacteria bacterium]
MADIATPVRPEPAADTTLDTKYTLESGRVYLTGTQALARLPMMQRERDLAAGVNTAGFISGYRGSPLGGLDQTLWRARKHLDTHHIKFQPGVNEDLAATAIWGTQQVNLFPGAKYDGVFSMWYGKGPGVDRCGDVFRHANAAGTAKFGGVLAVAGDDHAARSSTVAHQTEHIFKAVMMPVLAPSGVQDYLDLGLHGWAMSRYSGCWVAFKAVADTIESSASVYVDPHRVDIALPDYPLPPGGLNIRWPDDRLVQEQRLLHHKLYAALAYARLNKLNQIVIDSPNPRIGIITCGKSYLDVRQAFDDLGIDDRLATEIGIRLYKVGMVWPLESEGVRHFAEGLEEILVVEEKRQLLEYQLKEELYNWREDVRPRVIGKFDEKGEWAQPHGEWQLPACGELTPAMIARVIAGRIGRYVTSDRIRARLAFLEAKERALEKTVIATQRIPHFCSGCPHNTSTRVPEGSRALAGIGCHFMATWMNRSTATFSHMGGEGAAWVGQAPFTETRHVFANLGDGTYFHSGMLAVRAAVAAFNNPPPTPLPEGGGDCGSLRSQASTAPKGITYKILYNDAVAMTGGQPVDGNLSVPQMAHQLAAEGVKRIVVITDGTERAYAAADLPQGVPLRHRDALDLVQRELREFPGVSALIYDQTCAAEKRRRRKRGKFPDPARRVFINEAVCEGCGDCSEQSNCLSVVPVDTEFGRKRAIDQSACNKDYTCLKGFCPSFVTVEGGRLIKGKALAADESGFAALPEPHIAETKEPWGILITGVGGTGVITIGALIGMAAHLDGKGVTALDMTGLAQKFGAVFSHVRIAERPEDIHAVRVAAGEANAVIGGDIVVSANPEALAKMKAGFTRAVVNCAATPTAEFIRNPDWQFPLEKMQQTIQEATGEGRADFIDANGLATALMGDAIFGNLFLLGHAWQRGMVPVSLDALHKAIALNGVAVDANLKAFLWGRRAAHDRAAVERFARPAAVVELPRVPTLDDLITRRVSYLTDYQDTTYAARYRALVDKVRAAEAPLGSTRLAEAVAKHYFKLLAVKDEYEVARLHADPAFHARIAATFEGDYHLNFHLAPPLLSKADPVTGRPQKRAYGPWMLTALRWLARLKFLRGGALDVFGRTAERRLERELIAEYERDITDALAKLSTSTLDTAVALASLPEQIRGFGHVKLRAVEAAREKRKALLSELNGAATPAAKAA